MKNTLWLHRYAVAVACATFFLIIAGGLVTSTGSGLAVPDWPLSYGQVMPPMIGGIFFEHGHRMVAATVGLLTVILAIWTSRVEKRRWVRVLAWIALGAVITQGVLGGLTVLFLLPTPISVTHATLAQSFFSLTVVFALITSRGWKEGKMVSVGGGAQRTRMLVILTTAVIFLQLILGAVMRHTDSGLAIPDFPTTYGAVLPPFSEEGMDAIQAYRADYELPQVGLDQIWIHFVHRLGAILVAIVVLTLVVHVLRTYRSETRFREPAIILGILLVFQILLGAFTVWSGKSVPAATAHVATGALMLATSVFLTMRALRFTVVEHVPVSHLVPEASRV